MSITITTADLEKSLPDLTSNMHFSAISSPADIYRDVWGIPHIKAQNEFDLFFTQGYATAQDRLWHMDFDRFRALGRWSELVGRSGLSQDRLMRSAGLGRTAKQDYEMSNSAARQMADAYAAGVNVFIETTKNLPIEYRLLGKEPESWESWHCLAVYKMRNTLLGTFEPKLFRTKLTNAIGAEKVASLVKGYPMGHLLTVPPGEVYQGQPLDGLDQIIETVEIANWLNEVDAGSNAWSISGKLTESGLPLMAGDSHRALDTPSVYYQIHLTCPDFSVIGYSLPGVPGALHFCHNEYVAWGMTHGGADTQDLFIERLRRVEEEYQYLFQGEWLPTKSWTETIHVQGQRDQYQSEDNISGQKPNESVRHEIIVTHHGPVIAGDPASGTVVTISDPGLIAGSNWLDAAHDAMRSRSVTELHHAFRNWTDRVNNYAVADVAGNFGYLHAGKIPVRGQANGWGVVPGWSAEYEWQGYIPHDELPKSLNPEIGYIVTCNQRVTDHEYPYYVGLYFSPEFRAKRVQTRILELEPGQATVAAMKRIHADRLSLPAQVFTQALLEINPLDQASVQAQDLLREWNYEMDRNLVPPLIYAQTKRSVTHRLLREQLGQSAEEILSGMAGSQAHLRLFQTDIVLAIQHQDNMLLPEGQSWPTVLALALQEAIQQLKERLGDDLTQWHWGEEHQTRPQHPLSRRFPQVADLLNPTPLAIHGDGDTPLAGGYGISQFVATGMSVNRYIYDPSDWTKSQWIVPLGASGHPASPHYTDQAIAWSNVEYIPQLWNWEQIISEAESQQQLLPEKDY